MKLAYDLISPARVDNFQMNLMDVGEIKKIKIRQDNFGFMPEWNLDGVRQMLIDKGTFCK